MGLKEELSINTNRIDDIYLIHTKPIFLHYGDLTDLSVLKIIERKTK